MKQARGFHAARRRRYKVAREAVLHAGQYAYIGRKDRKSDMRQLWIQRLNAAAREHDLSYSKFIACLKKASIQIDRKILSDIAISDPTTFKTIVDQAKSA